MSMLLKGCGSPVSWFPLSVPGLGAAYSAGPIWDFTDTAGLEHAGDTSAVARVKDRSPNGFDLLQSVAGDRPTLNLSSNVWRLTFDGAGDRLASAEAAGLNGVSGLTVFVRGKYPLPSTQAFFIGKFDNPTTQASWMLRDTGGAKDVQFVIETAAGVNHTVASNVAASPGSNFRAVAYYDPGAAQIGVRVINDAGDSAVTAAAAAAPRNGTDPLVFGNTDFAGLLQYGLVYTRFLSSQERQDILDALV